MYEWDTILFFGKHEWKDIIEVIKVDTSYIEWCMINLDHFCLDHEIISRLEEQINETEAQVTEAGGMWVVTTPPMFKFSSEALDKNREKSVIMQEKADVANARADRENLMDFDAYEGDQVEWYGHND